MVPSLVWLGPVAAGAAGWRAGQGRALLVEAGATTADSEDLGVVYGGGLALGGAPGQGFEYRLNEAAQPQDQPGGGLSPTEGPAIEAGWLRQLEPNQRLGTPGQRFLRKDGAVIGTRQGAETSETNISTPLQAECSRQPNQPKRLAVPERGVEPLVPARVQ